MTLDRKSCGTCKHYKDVGYKDWGDCTAQVPRWAWFEDIVPTRQVCRDKGTGDLAPDCEAYVPKPNASNERQL